MAKMPAAGRGAEVTEFALARQRRQHRVRMMKLIPVTVEKDGALRLAREWPIPPKARLAVVALAEDEVAGGELALMAERGGSFDFLVGEPDLYTDADVIPGRANPDFGRGSSDVPAG